MANTLSTGSKNSMANTYTNAGTYTVSLTAQGPGGVTSLTNTAYIVVTPPSSSPTVPNPTIQFVGGDKRCTIPGPTRATSRSQTNGNLTMPNWANYGGPVTTSNGTNRVTVALPPTGYLFFRLTNQQAQNPAVPNLTIGLALNSVVVSWPNTGSFTLQTEREPGDAQLGQLRRDHQHRQRHQQRHPRALAGQLVLPPRALNGHELFPDHIQPEFRNRNGERARPPGRLRLHHG